MECLPDFSGQGIPQGQENDRLQYNFVEGLIECSSTDFDDQSCCSDSRLIIIIIHKILVVDAIMTDIYNSVFVVIELQQVSRVKYVHTC